MKILQLIKVFAVVLLFGCMLLSCHEQVKQEKPDRVLSIQQLEDSLLTTDGRLRQPYAAKLVDAYQQYATNKPADSLSVIYLFKAIDISMNLSDPKRSIGLTEQFIERYPNHPSTPNALFIKAFIYDDQLQDYENAKKTYLQFIDRYPNDALKDDAAAAINNLGKSPEEILKGFEMNQ